MIRVKIITKSIWLTTSCAGWVFLGSATLLGASQQVPRAHTYVPAKHAKAMKRTWHTGPASTPPETEIIPSSPPAAPPRIAVLFDSPAKPKESGAVNPHAGPHALSVRSSTATPAASVEQVPEANTDQPYASNSPDPEAQRIQDEFVRLRQDAAARRAFYDDLLGTVERVRAGMREENLAEEKPVSFQPSPRPSGKPPVGPVTPPHLPELTQPQEHPSAAKPLAPQSSLVPSGNRLDQVAYQRVVRWAKANNVPVPLALGVAWMESHLNTNPPRGSAGEVEMFQIMPERCRLEGWPSKRLDEPEFNTWMGTMLLARYYKEEGSVTRAAAKYVAGPEVFNKEYSKDMWAYINWYATTVDTYASYFSRYQS